MRPAPRPDGYVLLSAMMVLLAAAVMLGAFLLVTFTATRDAGYQEQDEQAFWIAEAGLEFAAWRVRFQNPKVSFSTTNVLLNGQYDATAAFVSPIYTIVATGTVTTDLYTARRVVTQQWKSGARVADTWQEQ